MSKYPRKAFIAYWDCGHGHRHNDKEHAARCVQKHITSRRLADQRNDRRKKKGMDRTMLALALRRDGLTHEAIGKQLGVGAKRAFQLVAKAKRVEAFEANRATLMRQWEKDRRPINVTSLDLQRLALAAGFDLSLNAIRCLAHAGIHPNDASRYSDAELLKIPRLGLATLREIRDTCRPFSGQNVLVVSEDLLRRGRPR